jgi:hypothetical protein
MKKDMQYGLSTTPVRNYWHFIYSIITSGDENFTIFFHNMAPVDPSTFYIWMLVVVIVCVLLISIFCKDKKGNYTSQ